MCSVRLSGKKKKKKKKATFVLYDIKRLLTTEMESVYCAIPTPYLNKTTSEKPKKREN
jgi:hypothetical protein